MHPDWEQLKKKKKKLYRQHCSLKEGHKNCKLVQTTPQDQHKAGFVETPIYSRIIVDIRLKGFSKLPAIMIMVSKYCEQTMTSCKNPLNKLLSHLNKTSRNYKYDLKWWIFPAVHLFIYPIPLTYGLMSAKKKL